MDLTRVAALAAAVHLTCVEPVVIHRIANDVRCVPLINSMALLAHSALSREDSYRNTEVLHQKMLLHASGANIRPD
jgi:hypothetical protein